MLFRRWATLLSLIPSNHYSRTCMSSGRRAEKVFIIAAEEHIVGVAKPGEEKHYTEKIILTCWIFVRGSWSIPDAISLFGDYVTLQGQVIASDPTIYQSWQNRVTIMLNLCGKTWCRYKTGSGLGQQQVNKKSWEKKMYLFVWFSFRLFECVCLDTQPLLHYTHQPRHDLKKILFSMPGMTGQEHVGMWKHWLNKHEKTVLL